jgi:hypothetical protein
MENHMKKLSYTLILSVATIAISSGEVAVVYNVKDPPYNAKGDGVTDDGAAIARAISDATGREVYFPAGKYLIGAGHAINPSIRVLLEGESREGVIIKAGTNIGTSPILLNSPSCSNSVIRNLTVDGNKVNQNVAVNAGIFLTFVEKCVVDNVAVKNSSGMGIGLRAAKNSLISNCRIEQSELDGVWADTQFEPSRGSVIKNCFISGYGRDGVLATDDLTVTGCTISQLQGNGAGIFLPTAHNKRVTLSNNVCRQNLTGMDIGFGRNSPVIDGGGAVENSGIIVTGNDCSENYGCGIGTGANGTVIRNNQCNNNGAGLANSNVIEPGAIPDFRNNPGTGYQAGDILTLSGGTFTRPAKFRVRLVGSGGALNNNTYITVMDMGDYSIFPTGSGPANSIAVTGGHGTGAHVIYTNSVLHTGGTGYKVGDILTATRVSGMRYPARFRVDAVSGGVIAAYTTLQGGGYTGKLPTTISVTGGGGTGATFKPCFGVRFPGALFTAGIGIKSRGDAGTWPTTGVVITGNTCTNRPGFSPQQLGVVLEVVGGTGSGQAVNYVIASNNLSNNAHAAVSKWRNRSELAVNPSGTISDNIVSGNIQIPSTKQSK